MIGGLVSGEHKLQLSARERGSIAVGLGAVVVGKAWCGYDSSESFHCIRGHVGGVVKLVTSYGIERLWCRELSPTPLRRRKVSSSSAGVMEGAVTVASASRQASCHGTVFVGK